MKAVLMAVSLMAGGGCGAHSYGASGQRPATSAISVSSAVGSVSLTLELPGARLSVKDSLWLRVRVKNMGRAPFSVKDAAFEHPVALKSRGELLRIEVVEAKTGRAMAPMGEESPPLTPEFQACLRDYESKRGGLKRTIPAVLKPGDEIATPPLRQVTLYEAACHGADESSPRPPFAEIADWPWKAGRYRVRAVYEHGLSAGARRRMEAEGRRVEPNWVDVATDWVELEVVR